MEAEHVYGPVPSHRLGRSLGIDLVPYKTCTYDCVYCQLGRTTDKTVKRREFVPVAPVLAELERRLSGGCRPDYVSLAGSGEPTLHSGMGRLIEGIKSLTDVPVAVITNGSLLWSERLQEELMMADVVLPSLDAGDEVSFAKINRPHPDISFDLMLEGLTSFTKRFAGEVWLEVMLLAGSTGTRAEAAKIAAHAEGVGAARIQLNTPSRPAAEAEVLPLSRDEMVALERLFPGRVESVFQEREFEAGQAGSATVSDSDLVALVRRRPCTVEDIAAGLGLHVLDVLKRVDLLLASGVITCVAVNGKNYYHPAGGGSMRENQEGLPLAPPDSGG
jgi:wyosine [tRNA(Phe)-imidazoG37] synthetase (radical SAM superfamily)